ncbi:MAG TPA: hypothetical protein VFB62_28145 [Polyangiaceae bacterium]|nr:hypothetical protein [Polyangiaceae bacterium]
MTWQHRILAALGAGALLLASRAATAEGEPPQSWQMPPAAQAEQPAPPPVQTPPPVTNGHRPPVPPATLAYPYPYSPAPRYAVANFGTQPYRYVPSTPDEPQEPERKPPFFDLAAGTQFPLGLGPQLTLEVPFRILLQAELAWMPSAYGSAINAMISAFGAEGAVVGPVIEDALADSFVFRASGGWRPFPKHGFEIFAGYTLIKVSGEAPADIVASIADDFEDEIEDTVFDPVAFDSTLHNFHIALGWRWLVFSDHLVIRANLGYTQTVGSASSIELPDHPDLEGRLNPVVDEELNRILTRDIKLPVIGLNAGYRF